MQDRPSDLTVRRYERLTCEARAVVKAHSGHGGELVFAQAVISRDGGVEASVVDVSEGGLGLMSGVYLPMNAKLHVRVSKPKQDGERLAGLGAFEAVVRVRRVEMVSHEPKYYIGCKFVEVDEHIEQRIEEAIKKGPLMRSRPSPLGGSDA